MKGNAIVCRFSLSRTVKEVQIQTIAATRKMYTIQNFDKFTLLIFLDKTTLFLTRMKNKDFYSNM